MKFAIACLAALATLATASAAAVPAYDVELHHLFDNTRVVNGQDAERNAHPYQISLQWRMTVLNSFSHICGGSIINELWIVSAAHCFTESPSFGTFRVVAGAHNLNQNEATQQARGISRRIIHPSYRGGVNPHDIVLIQLASPLSFNAAVAPILLPRQNAQHTGNVVLSGWGSTSMTHFPTFPIVLQTVNIPIVDTQTCFNALNSIVSNPPLDPFTLDNVCTGPIDDSRISACSGDSGGPLAQRIGLNWELVGVVSWGISPCGTIGAPSVYARTSAYIDWINGYIR